MLQVRNRLLALALEAGTRTQQIGWRTYSSTAVAARGWVPPEQRSRQLPNTRARRPLVNGQTVAFHVNELASLPNPNVNQYGVHVDIRQRFASRNNQQLGSKKQYDSDLIVVLDMDECLLHSKFLNSPQDAQIYAHQLKQQNDQRLNANGTMVDTFRVTLNDGTLVHVNVRPGLYDFLERVCSRYETHIFTAAMDVYANPVLDRIEAKLNRDGSNSGKVQFAGRWFRQHCTIDPVRRSYVKNLHNLWPHIQSQQQRPVHDTSRLSRAVLVDNNPMSFLANPENGILVSSFYTDSQDTTLPKVWDMLQELESEPDVRPALTARFALKDGLEAMEHQQIPLAQAA